METNREFQVLDCMACGTCIMDSTPILPLPTLHPCRTLASPNVAETTPIQESLLYARSAIARIDDEIAKLSAILNDLHSRRDILDRMVTDNESFLAPIRRLPADIGKDIHIMCPFASNHKF